MFSLICGTLDSGKQTEGYRREQVGVWGIKGGMCCDECLVLYTTNESLNTTSKTNDVLYVG